MLLLAGEHALTNREVGRRWRLHSLKSRASLSSASKFSLMIQLYLCFYFGRFFWLFFPSLCLFLYWRITHLIYYDYTSLDPLRRQTQFTRQSL